MTNSRPDWHQYFMAIAHVVALRASCPRASVGAVLVRDRAIVATGYNGAISGASHCIDDGCIMEDGHCVATVHAEVNALSNAARIGSATGGSTMYVTCTPCWKCYQNMVNAGVVEIRYATEYRPDTKVLNGPVRCVLQPFDKDLFRRMI